MPGAYAHITLVHSCIDATARHGGLSPATVRAVTTWRSHAELGAVSPDYPYLPGHTEWADLMHHEATNALLRAALLSIQTLSGEPRDRAVAWLLGYASHMVADMTIHPVINALVGPYEQNKAAHRACEMNMDAQAFKRMGLGDVGLSDHLLSNLAACCAPADPTELDAVVAEVWTRALCQAHPQTAARDTPAPRLWHHGFLRVMSAIREANHLLPFARHLGVDAELDYPDPKDIDSRYVQALPTPLGPMDYDPLLDRAIDNAIRFWGEIDAVLSGADPHRLDALPSWNLDTGLSTGAVPQKVYWREG